MTCICSATGAGRGLAGERRRHRRRSGYGYRAMHTFQVGLPHDLAPRAVEFSAYAVNGDGLKARWRNRLYAACGHGGAAPGLVELWRQPERCPPLNSKLPQSAVNDARLLGSALQKRLRATTEFTEVVGVELLALDAGIEASSLYRDQGQFAHRAEPARRASRS
ncbi:MAG: hypothetical protein U1F68_09955 [Gammaproteobacteria bacterium]